MAIREKLRRIRETAPPLKEALESGNVRVLRNMLGPAWRGFVQQRGKSSATTTVDLSYPATFIWDYERESPSMARLYEAAKKKQWNATTDVDWGIDVDPLNPEVPLLPDRWVPMAKHPTWSKLTEKEQTMQRHAIMSWLLSQFLHGEQGALFASAQVVEAVPWMDAKLYGSTQVVDEGRHVEVFHGYLTRKLNKLYEIDDNLYTVIDALMTDNRWDLKFLGMQIMIEGLALGAFSAIRNATNEPLLKDILKYVITDEARHVHYGVLALSRFYKELGDDERAEREDWAYEVSRMLRNRFLAREVYHEYWTSHMSLAEWDQLVLQSDLMALFRETLFKRIVPNLRKIGLLSDRIRPRYEQLGVLHFEHGKAADEIGHVSELLGP